MNQDNIISLAKKLLQGKRRLSVAESCTGGWLAKELTDIAGSSQWFDRGFVTYSNAAKHEMLGVLLQTIEQSGAVSEEVVCEMALGVLEHSPADVAVAISGIAGPGGGSVDKPVGTVWFAWCMRNDVPVAQKKIFPGDRNAVREAAVKYAVEHLLEQL